ncbi:MAG: methionyl-tRNA formyltransferase [Candidatus Muiribacteriota bacterium]
MNIVFMGTPNFCIPSLEELYKNCFIQAVVTQTDKKCDRGQRISETPVKKFALKNNIPVLQPAKIRNNEDFFQSLKKLSPDLIVVIAYGKILPQQILDIPKYGCVNIHASLLPYHRGPAPIQYSILTGDSVTGVTSMLMNEKMDEGDILHKIEYKMAADETAGTLHDKLAELSARCVVETVEKIKTGNFERIVQDHSKATYTKYITKELGLADWSKSSEVLYRVFRATVPWPGFYSYINQNYFKMVDLEPLVSDVNQPGKILNVSKDGIEISCGKGSILIKKIQIPGKKVMEVCDFLNGNNWFRSGEFVNLNETESVC